MTDLNKIYNEDCRDFMKRLAQENFIKVDVIVTSPPYNLDKKYGVYDDNQDRNKYLQDMHEVAELSYAILREDGSFFLNVGEGREDPLLPLDIVREFENAVYQIQNTFHWIKAITMKKSDIGKSTIKTLDSFFYNDNDNDSNNSNLSEDHSNNNTTILVLLLYVVDINIYISFIKDLLKI